MGAKRSPRLGLTCRGEIARERQPVGRRVVRVLFQRFPDNLPVGTPEADFTVQAVSGEKISLCNLCEEESIS